MKCWILWIALSHASISAAQERDPVAGATSVNPATFAKDVGLALSQVQSVEAATGPTHYRMRRYHFYASDAAIGKISGRFQMRKIDQNSPFDMGIKTLFTIYSPHWQHTSQRPWRIWDFVPPYQHTFIACYPSSSNSTSSDFAFRMMTVAGMPETNGQREVFFAAGNAVPNAPSTSGCTQTNATFRLMYGSDAAFAFAERSFDEFVSDTLPSIGLHYHGVFSVDPDHYFRFRLSAAQFQKLLSAKPFLKKLSPRRVESDYAERENLAWWLAPAQRAANTWYGFCERAGNSAEIVKMNWYQGFVYWRTRGIAAPSAAGRSCY